MFFNGFEPKPEACCGCNACVETCSHEALSLKYNHEGFIVPILNYEKCIECGACEKVCPMLHSSNAIEHSTQESYAAINKNNHELFQSSSGGIFVIIAKHVLSKGGIVYGAMFDENFNLKHGSVESVEELFKLQGSKYLQSRIDGIFKEVRSNLKNGRIVYFTGTGCQVSALKLFLKKEYTNLITSDILCHGTPPQRVFDVVISYLSNKYHGKVIKYNFRDKRVWGWSCSSSSSSIQKRKIIKYVGFDSILDGYFNAYIKGDNYRESCYRCPYAQNYRCGDITLSDFWGVEKFLKINNVSNGVSAIIINTDKGRILLKQIEESVNLIPSHIEDINVINKTLITSTPRPEARNYFFQHFEKYPQKTLLGYSQLSMKKYVVYTLKRNRYTNYLIKIFKDILKK